jgi:hypothetical protein
LKAIKGDTGHIFEERRHLFGCMFVANPRNHDRANSRVFLRIIDSDAGMSSHPTARPYPVQYVSDWTTTGGMALVIRPIRPEDEPLMLKFHGTL